MFGLTLEKLFVIGILAAVIIGPQRLPLYTQKAAKLIAQFKAFISTTRERAEAEIGVPLDPKKWEELDLKQYDPRRIVREALVAPAVPVPAAGSGSASDSGGDSGADPVSVADPAGADPVTVADPGPVDPAAAGEPAVADPAAAADPNPAAAAEPVADPAVTAPEPRRANPSSTGRGKRYAVSGSSAHPWRVRLPEPAEGPSDDAASDEFVEEPSVR